MLNPTQECKLVRSVAPQSVVGTINGAAVDTRGYEEALWSLDCGAITATGTLDVKIQESADGSTGWVDIASAVFSQKTNATQNTIFQGYVAVSPTRKAFQRAVATQATAAVLASVSCILGRPRATGAQANAFVV